MKILHIIPTYRPAWSRGGPIVSVHNLNKWLVKKGVSVTVYTTDIDVGGKVPLASFKDGKIEGIQDIDGVKVCFFRASFPRIWEYWRVGFLPAFLPRHWEYSRDLHRGLAKTAKDFDVIHITSTFLFASALGVFYAKKYKKPCILSPRGNLMEPLELRNSLKKRIYIALIESWALKNVSIIHFTVPQEEVDYKTYRKDYFLPMFRSSLIIPNGIEEDEFLNPPARGHFREQFNINPQKKIILFLGRLNWKKGLDTLIPAFALVLEKEPEALLVIVGGDEGGHKRNVKLLITSYQLQDKVIFTGMLVGKEKLGVLQDADLFILPSYSENFGMAVVEAMYFGLPVVITKAVGVAQYVESAGAGIVIEKDEKSCANAILEILQNPAKAKEVGERGRKLVVEKFMMPNIADCWVEAYKELITK